MKRPGYFVHVMVLGAFLTAGCAPAAPASPKAPAKSVSPAPVKNVKNTKETKDTKAGKPVEFAASGPNLLDNPSFENWSKEGTLNGWNLAEGSGKEWKPVKAVKAPGAAGDKTAAIEIPPPSGENITVLMQSLPPAKALPGRRFVLSAKVNSTEKEAVHIVLTFRADKKEQTVRLVSSGVTGWEKLSKEFWLPKEADPKSLRVRFIVQRGVKAPVQLDEACLQLMSPKESVQTAPAAPVSKKK